MGFSHHLSGLIVADGRTEGVQHEIELFDDGRGAFLRVWIGGIGADMGLTMRLSAKQAVQLQQGLQQVSSRIGLGGDGG